MPIISRKFCFSDRSNCFFWIWNSNFLKRSMDRLFYPWPDICKMYHRIQILQSLLFDCCRLTSTLLFHIFVQQRLFRWLVIYPMSGSNATMKIDFTTWENEFSCTVSLIYWIGNDTPICYEWTLTYHQRFYLIKLKQTI